MQQKKLISLAIIIYSGWFLYSFSTAVESGLYQQGIDLIKKTQFAEATTVLEQYLATDSTNAKAYYNLGLAYVNLKKYDDAVAAWQKAIELNPKFEEAHYNLGLVYIMPDAYHTSDATTEFLAVLNLNPNNYKARFQLATGYIRLGLYDSAIKELDKVIQLKPDLLGARKLRLQLYEMTANFPAAMQEAQWLFQKDKTDINKAIIFNLHLNYGVALRMQKKYPDAISELYRAQKLFPDHLQVHYELANTYTAMGQLQKAETLYQQVLSRDPKNPNLLNNIALFYTDHQYKLDQATILIDSALQLVPQDQESAKRSFLDTKGWIEYGQGNYPGAYSKFSTILEQLIAPYQPDPMIDEKDRAAFLAIQPNYNAFPEVILARYHLALAASKIGEKEQSRNLLEQIIAVTAQDPVSQDIQQKAKDWLGVK
jgi:tetratricopeptide (TPR) repeat protein